MPQNSLDAEFLRELFRDREAAFRLLDEVQGFYGNSLRVLAKEAIGDDTSGFTLDVDAQNLIFRSVTINLNTRSDRVTAAACHELLHLQLKVRGFPTLRSLALNPSQEQIMAQILDRQLRGTINALDHDIFLNDFLAIGFPLSQFLTHAPWQHIDFEEEAKNTGNLPTEVIWGAWAWWLSMYLNYFLSGKQGMENSDEMAEEVTKWGGRALPGFNQVTGVIRQWLARGDHRRPEKYADSIRELLRVMQYPTVTGFYVLRPNDRSVPRMEAVL